VPIALRESALRLHRMADRVAFVYAAAGGMLGFVCGAVTLAAFGSFEEFIDPFLSWEPNRAELVFVSLLGVLLGGLCGWQLGAVKAERLRVEAETLLCQAHLEENARAAQSGARRTAGGKASKG